MMFFRWLTSGAAGGLAPITLTWITDGTDNTPTLTIDVPIGIMLENDTWEIEFYSDAALTNLLDEATDLVNATDAGDGDIDGTLGDPLSNGTVYARARVTRGGTPVTAWSNTASQTIAVAGGDDDEYPAWLAAA